MTLLRVLLRYAGLAPAVLALGLAMLTGGCNRDSDKVAVRLFQERAVARPGNPQGSANPPLRVAVAAMISPKETLEVYRQLLTYLGHKLGKNPSAGNATGNTGRDNLGQVLAGLQRRNRWASGP